MIFIDYREDGLIRLFRDGTPSILRPGASPSHTIDVRNLLIGDVWITTTDGVLRTIIERKTTSDLWASIKDGRFHEQHDRAADFLRKQGGSVAYILLIEKTPSDMPRETLLTLLTRPDEHINDNITMMIRRSDGICDTVDMIRRLNDKDTPTTPKERCDAEAVWKAISRTMRRRQDAITPSTVLSMLISLTPKVSFKMAQQMTDGFRDVSEFVLMMKDEPDKWEAIIRPACGRMHLHIIRSMRSLLFSADNDQKAPSCSAEACVS